MKDSGLEDLQFEKTEKGHLKVCGKIRKGGNVYTGCIIVAGQGVNAVPISGDGHPEVQKELLKFVRDHVRVK